MFRPPISIGNRGQAMSDQDQTKARLLEAAGEEFAAKGFEQARVREICRKAGANTAAINYHFGDKEQLYIRAVVEAHRCGIDGPDEPGGLVGPPVEQLRRFIRHFLERVLAVEGDGGWQHALMLREMSRPTRASEALVQESIRPRFDRLVAILARACPEADARRLQALAFSVVGQCLFYKVGRPVVGRLVGPEGLAGLDLEFLVDHITAFTAAALGLAQPMGAGEIVGGAR